MIFGWKNVWQNIVYFRRVLLIILKALKLDQYLNLSIVIKFNIPQTRRTYIAQQKGWEDFNGQCRNYLRRHSVNT